VQKCAGLCAVCGRNLADLAYFPVALALWFESYEGYCQKPFAGRHLWRHFSVVESAARISSLWSRAWKNRPHIPTVWPDYHRYEYWT
jgi:hypothetical protein